MTSVLRVIDYEDKVDGKNVYQSYTVETNCYHVLITKNERGTGTPTNEVVFKRDGLGSDWLDEKHSRITEALNELENVILAAVRKEN